MQLSEHGAWRLPHPPAQFRRVKRGARDRLQLRKLSNRSKHHPNVHINQALLILQSPRSISTPEALLISVTSCLAIVSRPSCAIPMALHLRPGPPDFACSASRYACSHPAVVDVPLREVAGQFEASSSKGLQSAGILQGATLHQGTKPLHIVLRRHLATTCCMHRTGWKQTFKGSKTLLRATWRDLIAPSSHRN